MIKLNKNLGTQLGKDSDLKHEWGIGEVRTAVIKKNDRGNNAITYAPGGKVVVLKNDTDRQLAVGDVVEVYILEEKRRKFFGKVIEVNIKYAEIQKHARSKGENFRKRFEVLLTDSDAPVSIEKLVEMDKKIDSFREEVGKKVQALSKNVSRIDSDVQNVVEKLNGIENLNGDTGVGEEEEESEDEEISLPVECEVGVQKDKKSYALAIRDKGVAEFIGGLRCELKFDVFVTGSTDDIPISLVKQPWSDGRVRIPVNIKDNFTPAYEGEGDIPVIIRETAE